LPVLLLLTVVVPLPPLRLLRTLPVVLPTVVDDLPVLLPLRVVTLLVVLLPWLALLALIDGRVVPTALVLLLDTLPVPLVLVATVVLLLPLLFVLDTVVRVVPLLAALVTLLVLPVLRCDDTAALVLADVVPGRVRPVIV
jgi:hypothetical protein